MKKESCLLILLGSFWCCVSRASVLSLPQVAKSSLQKIEPVTLCKGRITDLHKAAFTKDISQLRELVCEQSCESDLIVPVLNLNAADICLIGQFKEGLELLKSEGIEPNHERCKSVTKSHLEVLFAENTDEKNTWQLCKKSSVLENGATPLHLIAIGGCIRMVQFMRTWVYDSEIFKKRDKNGFLPVHYAALYGTKETFTHFLDYYETSTDEQGVSQGLTVFHCAAHNNDPEVLKRVLCRELASIRSARGETVLHSAALGGFDDHLKLLKEAGISFEVQADRGRMPLHFAAVNKSSSCLEYLLNVIRCAPDVKDDDGLTAAHHAALSGTSRNLFILLIECPRLKDIRTANGATLLHLATHNPDISVLKFLLQVGYDVEVEDNKGLRPLHHAALNGSTDHILLLCKHEASLLTRTNAQETILHWGAQNSSPDVVALLLIKGCDPHARDMHGGRPHHFAALAGKEETLRLLLTNAPLTDAPIYGGLRMAHFAVYNSEEGIIGLCRKAGFAFDVQDESGRTPLGIACALSTSAVVKRVCRNGGKMAGQKESLIHLASGNLDASVLQYLISLGTKVRAKNSEGSEPIHVAAKNGTQKNMELLLDAGASLDARTQNGDTVLHEAAKNKLSKECAAYVIAQKKELVDEKNSKGLTPLVLAVVWGTVDTVKVLESQGVPIEGRPLARQMGTALKWTSPKNETMVHLATLNKDVSVLRYLCNHERHVDPQFSAIHHKAHGGLLPIHYAALHASPEHIEVLLASKSASQTAFTDDGQTLIHLAAQNSNSVTLSFLIRRGFDLNVQDQAGETPLFKAARLGLKNNIKLLISLGASLVITNKRGVSVLHIAAQSGSDELLAFLIDKGMNPEHIDDSGNTALHYAAKECLKEGQVGVIRELLKARASLQVKNGLLETPSKLIKDLMINVNADLQSTIVENYKEERDYQSWLGHAENDMVDAKKLASSDNCLYHAQQAAEKALKALLVLMGIQPPTSHDLYECVKELSKRDTAVSPELKAILKKLNPFSNMSRYPARGPEKSLTLEPREAIEGAQKVMQFSKKQIHVIRSSIMLNEKESAVEKKEK